MNTNSMINLDNNDLSDIRDAVPALDLVAIRSLRRAGFRIVRQNSDADGKDDKAPAQSSDWSANARSSNSAA